MISIFDDLIRNKEIKKIDIVDYIEFYKEKYLELNKKYEYYYDIYDTINNIQIKEKLDEEIKQYQTEDPKFFDFKKETPIDTLFMKSCLLESLQLVINEKSRKDKDLKVSIKKYKKNKYNYYPNSSDYSNYEDFIKEITLRKEFNIHQISKKKEE